MKTLHFEEQPGYTRPPTFIVSLMRGLREACIVIAIVCWACAVAIWDTVFAGKSEREQIGGGK